MKGRVLVVAGSDSGGGAGIQADIKAITALGGFAATAITALTAQNTLGVHGVQAVPVAFIRQQMRVVLEDIGADVMKTGMLHDAATIEAVCAEIPAGLRLVADPVMMAKGGHALLRDEAVATLKRLLLPRATVLTPNLPEAEVLTGLRIRTQVEMRAAVPALLALGPQAVLLKGGHLEGSRMLDLLASAEGVVGFEGERVDTPHTHGTGCTMASALAVGLAQGLSLHDAVKRARDYVLAAIQSAPGYGAGHGPLNHAVWSGQP